MWYEMLPCVSIIAACLAVPTASVFVVHHLFLGKAYRRTLITSDNRYFYRRDERLTGHAYKLQGLEALKDAED